MTDQAQASQPATPPEPARSLLIVESRKDLVIVQDQGTEKTVKRSDIADDDPNKPVGLGDHLYIWASPEPPAAQKKVAYHAKPEEAPPAEGPAKPGA